MTALTALLSDVVDYAGLFPPAGLDLSQVVSNYEEYQQRTHRWMLGRLIIPADKLLAFSGLAQGIGCGNWRISSLVPSADAPEALEQAWQEISNTKSAESRWRVDAVECKVSSPAQVGPLARSRSEEVTLFVEVPFQDPAPAVEAIADIRSGEVMAKIRTGALSQDQIPTTEQVAGFIAICAEHQVGFKATAGLHHPIRASYPLTYETNAPCGMMHGFINVFLAACFAFGQKWDQDQLQALLDETDPATFDLQPESIAWRDWRISVETIKSVRQKFAVSFGSCSFVEPIEDLTSLGWLNAPAQTAG